MLLLEEVIDSDNINKTDDMYYQVGSNSYIYICKNALKPNHQCQYTICGDCYSKEQTHQSSTTRTRRNIHKNKDENNDENKIICEHELYSLKEFSDERYFSTNYLKKVNDNGDTQAQNCVKCWKLFTNEKLAVPV